MHRCRTNDNTDRITKQFIISKLWLLFLLSRHKLRRTSIIIIINFPRIISSLVYDGHCLTSGSSLRCRIEDVLIKLLRLAFELIMFPFFTGEIFGFFSEKFDG